MEYTGLEGSMGGLLERSPRPDDAGSTFVLAAGGLRRLRGHGEVFMGHPARGMFWRDVRELVHEDDLPHVGALISSAMARPGVSLAAGLRLRDASGDWRPVDVTVRNVLEAPGDTGLVVATVRAAPDGDGHSPDDQR